MRARFASWNQRLSRSLSPMRVGWVGFVICLLMNLGYQQSRFGLNGPPSTSGDEASYDSIAWQLSEGRGYRFNSIDERFRAPYERAGQAEPERFRLRFHDDYLDTTRPPLYPHLMAGLNLIWGRQFWAIRIVDTVAMSAVCGLAVWFVAARCGTLGGLVVLPLFVLLDVRTRLYSRAILTESITAVLVTLIVLTLLRYQRNHSWTSLVLCGVLTGIAWLARSAILLWLPLLGVAVFIAAFERRSPWRWRGTIGPVVVYLTACCLVYAPWMIRNFEVTDGRYPLGTQGASELVAGFSDLAWENAGRWSLTYSRAEQPDVPWTLNNDLNRADTSTALATKWIQENPLKAVALIPLKIGQELRPRTVPEGTLLTLAVLGALVDPRPSQRRILLLFVAACLFGIGLTWSVEGRFLVPLLFVQHVFAAQGLLWIIIGGNGPPVATFPDSTTGQSTSM